MSHIDDAINRFLRREGRRMLNRAEVLALGGSDDLIETRLAQHHWRHLHPGVYLVGSGLLDWDERCLASWLAAPPPAAISMRAAVLWWELEGISSAPIELTVRHGTHSVVDGAIRHRTRRLEGFVRHRGAVVTSVERTLAEVGRFVPQILVEQAFTSAWRKKLTTPEKVADYLERHGSMMRPGFRILTAVVNEYADGQRVPGSPAEVDALQALRDALAAAGIEPPERQVEVDLPDGSVAVLDLAWPELRRAVEPRGHSFHGDIRKDAYDFERLALLREAGWDVMPVAPWSVRHRKQQTVASIIRFLRRPMTGGSTDAEAAWVYPPGA